jgi:hypothetical protein
MDSLSDFWNLASQHIGLVISILFLVFAAINLLGRPSHAGEDVPGDYVGIKAEAEAARTRAENDVMNRYARHFPEKKP